MGVTQPAVAAFERAGADPKLLTIRRYAIAVGGARAPYSYWSVTSVTPTIQPASSPATWF